MPYEILYTSAPSGLKPGSSGYCTVKSSRGIPAPAVDLLESLSGYRHVFTPGSPEAARNPVNWGHYFLRISGRTEHVLSRVSDCELDYTGRSNKLAHHMVIDASCPAGPAWLVGQPGWMIGQWDGQLEQFATVRKAPPERRAAGRCAAWEAATGDAGWGGALAESFLADPERKVFIIYRPDQNILPLIEEAIALLPENRRWEVTFATYGAALPKTVECAWTGVVAGSPEVQQSRRFVNALRIDLTAPIPKAQGGTLVDFARTGAHRKTRPSPRRPDAPNHPVPVMPSNGPHAPPHLPPDVPSLLAIVEEEEEPLPPSLPQRGRKDSRGGLRLVLGVFLIGVVAASAVLVAFFVVRSGRHSLTSGTTIDRPDGSQDSGVTDTGSSSNNATGSPPSSPDDGVGGSPSSPPASEATDANPVARNDSSSRPQGNPADVSGQKPATKGQETPKPPIPASDIAGSPGMSQPRSGQGSTEINQSPPSGTEVAAATGSSQGKKIEGPPMFYADNRHGLKFGSAPNHVAPIRFSVKPASQFKDVARVSFLVPRGRTSDGVPQGLYHIGKQEFSKGVLSVVGVGKTFRQSQFDVQFAADGGTILIATLKTKVGNLHESHGLPILYGLFQIEDASGRTAYLCIGKPARTDVQFEIHDGAARLAPPQEIGDFLKTINPDDILVDDIQLTWPKYEFTQSSANDESFEWMLEKASEGLMKTLNVSRRASVDAKQNVRLEVSHNPSVAEANKLLNDTGATLLESLIKLSSPHKIPTPSNALAPTHAPAPPAADIDTAASQFEKAVEDALSTKVANKELKEAEKETQLDQFRPQLTKYCENVKRYYRQRTFLSSLQSEIRLTGGSIRYRVYPMTSLDTAGVASLPDGQKHLTIDLWSFEHR